MGPCIKAFLLCAEESVIGLFRNQFSEQSTQRLRERIVMSWWMAVFVLCSLCKFTSCYVINHDKLGLCWEYRLIIPPFCPPSLLCLCSLLQILMVPRSEVPPCTPLPPPHRPFCVSPSFPAMSPAQSGPTEEQVLTLPLSVTSTVTETDWNNSSAKVCSNSAVIWTHAATSQLPRVQTSINELFNRVGV